MTDTQLFCFEFGAFSKIKKFLKISQKWPKKTAKKEIQKYRLSIGIGFLSIGFVTDISVSVFRYRSFTSFCGFGTYVPHSSPAVHVLFTWCSSVVLAPLALLVSPKTWAPGSSGTLQF